MASIFGIHDRRKTLKLKFKIEEKYLKGSIVEIILINNYQQNKYRLPVDDVLDSLHKILAKSKILYSLYKETSNKNLLV